MRKKGRHIRGSVVGSTPLAPQLAGLNNVRAPGLDVKCPTLELTRVISCAVPRVRKSLFKDFKV